MRIKFNKKFLKHLEKKGLTIINPLIILDKKISIESHFDLELPCAINAEILTYKNKIKMGAYSYMGKNVSIQSDVNIGRYCTIGNHSKIGLQPHPIDQLSTSPYFYCENWFNGWNKDFKEIIPFKANTTVNIGNDVLIGCDVKIMAGVTIGDGAVIGAGAIITKDVEPYAIVVKVNEILRYREKPKGNFAGSWWKYDQVTKKILNPNTLNRDSLQKLYNRFKCRFFNSILIENVISSA